MHLFIHIHPTTLLMIDIRLILVVLHFQFLTSKHHLIPTEMPNYLECALRCYLSRNANDVLNINGEYRKIKKEIR